MKRKVTRTYVGSQVMTHCCEEMGQSYGRSRLTPAEAQTLRELSRWHSGKREEALACLPVEPEVIEFSEKHVLHELAI